MKSGLLAGPGAFRVTPPLRQAGQVAQTRGRGRREKSGSVEVVPSWARLDVHAAPSRAAGPLYSFFRCVIALTLSGLVDFEVTPAIPLA